MHTVPTTSAVCSAATMAETHGKKSCTKTRTLEPSIWLGTRGTRRRFMRRYGRLGDRRGMFIRLGMGRVAGYTNRPTRARPGIKSTATGFPRRAWAELGLQLL